MALSDGSSISVWRMELQKQHQGREMLPLVIVSEVESKVWKVETLPGGLEARRGGAGL